MTIWIIIGFLVILAAVAVGVGLARKNNALPKGSEEQGLPAKVELSELEATIELPIERQVPVVVSGLGTKLGKTRESLVGRLSRFLDRGQGAPLQSKEWEEIEEILLEADVGVQTSLWLMKTAKERLEKSDAKGLRQVLHGVGEELFGTLPHGRFSLGESPKPFVISIVGINGVGKTTTIGKLANQFTAAGKTVLLGAADTFRAGAIAQLKVWADRANAQFVTGREGADPGAVAFDSVTAGVARKIDVVLLDTAGRLHTKSNLMEELKKIHRVVKKVLPEAPHETWLVIDGTLGQNSLIQAKEFQKTMDLTGVIVTKLDGTAKGGAVLAIASELKLPIRYIGVGEAIEDLTPFEPKAFLDAILG